MAIPYRGNTGHGTYFITSCTFQKQQLLQSDRMATLLLNVLLHYRQQQKYLLHEFVIMPDHFHLLVKRGLVKAAEQYKYSSAHAEFVLDAVPQRLKPIIRSARNRSAEALRHPKSFGQK